MEQKKVYSCRIFTVWEEQVLLPNGKTTCQSWVEHKPTVAVVAVNDQNEILLVRQYRNPAKQTLWEIPAGTMDNGQESPTECAVRELAEETSFSARNIAPLFSGYLLPGYCNEYMHFFLATNLVYKPLPPDESEFIEVVPVSAQQADMLIEKGEIIDAKTVLGLLLARQHLTRIPT